MVPSEMKSYSMAGSLRWTHLDIVALDNSELSNLNQVLEGISDFVKSIDCVDIVFILDEVFRLNFISSS